MDHAKFNILDAARNAYLFLWRERFYVLRLCAVPLLLQIATSFFITFNRAEASVLEVCLWSLPATALSGWVCFAITSLLLLGEYARTPAANHADRRRAMKATLILYVLLNMGFALVALVLGRVAENLQEGGSLLHSLSGLVAMGAVFWAVRFTILPLVAAVQYPLRQALRRTTGGLFSLRLIAMAFLCVIPVHLVLGSLLGITGIDLQNPTPEKTAILLAAAALYSILTTAILTAAAAYALKDILGKKPS